MRPRRRRRLKAIAVLPTLLTLGNLICGFAAIHFCLRAMYTLGAGVTPDFRLTLNNPYLEMWFPTHLAIGAGLIFLGMFFDMFDGWAARATQRTGDFGGQLDSLADVVTFGVAPALLVIAVVTSAVPPAELTMSPLASHWGGRIAWVCAALYAACAALRLARFNVENEHAEQAHMSFRGLPSPGAAALLASLVILHETMGPLPGRWLVRSLPFWTGAAGLLMVSRIPYIHFANAFLRGRRSLLHVMLIIAVLGLFIASPALTSVAVLIGYVLSGPALWVWRRSRRAARPVIEAPRALAPQSPRPGDH
ncbi:MAG TPA: CDP-alcohol phosphatidyltransferase family protein [Phycisphaerae bacterium]|jgi:CDP-diacylglycerol--serine O-phosphatidyltransferase